MRCSDYVTVGRVVGSAIIKFMEEEKHGYFSTKRVPSMASRCS